MLARYFIAIVAAFIVSIVTLYYGIGIVHSIQPLWSFEDVAIVEKIMISALFIFVGFNGVFVGSIFMQSERRWQSSILLTIVGLAFASAFWLEVPTRDSDGGHNYGNLVWMLLLLAIGGMACAYLRFRMERLPVSRTH